MGKKVNTVYVGSNIILQFLNRSSDIYTKIISPPRQDPKPIFLLSNPIKFVNPDPNTYNAFGKQIHISRCQLIKSKFMHDLSQEGLTD